tara:strand:+ start:1510 stop:1899 length:390 start_codon:yes stop_codon:yes gene_type:complete
MQNSTDTLPYSSATSKIEGLATRYSLVFGGVVYLLTYSEKAQLAEPNVEIITSIFAVCAGITSLCWQFARHTAHSQMQYTQYCASVEKDILIQVVDSREYSALEKQIVLGILNKQYPGWSINVESTATI